ASKKLRWTSSKNSVATIPESSKVGTSCKVSAKKKGTATIKATAMDGSGKSAKIKLKVTPFVSDKTPAPTATPDPRVTTVIEDFESYAPGTPWTRFTAGGFASPGTMTVVQDPENAENKCLQIQFNGNDNSYDLAPIFDVDLTKPELKDSNGVSTAESGKKLGSYSGIKLDARVVGNDPSAVQYKKIYCYFDQAGNMKSEDYFATSNNEGPTAHVADKRNRFGVNISMAEGDDKENGVILHNNVSSKESNQYFPFAYSTWQVGNPATHFAQDSCTTGYKMTEGEPNVGFASRIVTFNTDRINEADKTLLDQTKFDMVLGSTYEGGATYRTNGITVTLYLDNIAFVEEDIPLEGIEVSAETTELTPGQTTKVSVKYTPENTTHKSMVYTSSDENVLVVDSEGNVTAKALGTAVITATPKDNPALAKSVTFSVITVSAKTEDMDVLKTATIVAKSDEAKAQKSETDAKFLEDGNLEISYTKINQSIVLDLGQEYDLRGYQGVELTGKVPGQMALELYDSTLDMTKSDWYEKYAGFTYPFFGASCSYRYEEGAFNKTATRANGYVAASNGNLLASPETLRYSFNTLTGTKGTGDYSKIRYIVLKSNKVPSYQEGKLWTNPDKYLITSLKFTIRQINTGILDSTTNVISERNVAVVESGTAEYLKADDGTLSGMKGSAGETTFGYYLDILDGVTRTKESHNDAFDLTDYTYVKVQVASDVTQLDVKLAGKAVGYDDAILVGSDTGSGERTVYFPLSDLVDADITALDTLRICTHGGTVKWATVVTGYPRYDTSYPNQYIVNKDGTTRALTEAEDKD
ncbi:MAG: Ig-like domain-containing protein, partial [Roseburia sp.]|nr:Ig-like domain-containing protein [Roseburia sp.]